MSGNIEFVANVLKLSIDNLRKEIKVTSVYESEGVIQVQTSIKDLNKIPGDALISDLGDIVYSKKHEKVLGGVTFFALEKASE